MSRIETQSSILFRTGDLNGATAEILLRTGTRVRLNKVIECDRENIDTILENFIDSGEFRSFKNIFIIGTGFSRKNADLLDKIVSEEGIRVIYRDHHKESLDLSKYMWGRILIWDRDGNEISSSKNLFREFVDKTHIRYIRLSILVDLVNASVTSYKPEEDIEGSKTIEQLFSLAGNASKFVENMTEKLMSNDAFFNEADILAIIEQEKREQEEREAKLAELKSRRKRQRTGI